MWGVWERTPFILSWPPYPLRFPAVTWWASGDNHTGFLSEKVSDVVSELTIPLYSLLSFRKLSGIMELPRLLSQRLPCNSHILPLCSLLLFLVALHWWRSPTLVPHSFFRWPLNTAALTHVLFSSLCFAYLTEIFWASIFPIFIYNLYSIYFKILLNMLIILVS